MKFFFPKVDEQKQEEIYQGVRKFVVEEMGWNVTNRRIYSIDYVHDGRALQARVGELDEIEGEKVCAIFESNAYLVCTANRGVLRGLPILVGKNEVHEILDFDA